MDLEDRNEDVERLEDKQSGLNMREGKPRKNGFKLSEKIDNKLYPYQKEGVAWFWKLYKERKGGILGDDKGLGRTIQVISFLSGMFEQGHIKTALIIMPVSLMENWGKELKKWAPNIQVSDFHGGSVKQRRDNLLKIQTKNGICLTTYGMSRTSHKQFSTLNGGDFIWDYIILDEGHKIKNTAIKTTKAIRQIHARNRFILTETPIQNNLREMWALFDFVCEGQLLGTARSFKQEYENLIVRARESDATDDEKRVGQEKSEHLRQLIAPHFLRRTNGTEPPKLPRKNDFIIWLYLSDAQLQIYRHSVISDRVKEVLMSKRSPLVELNVLKKVCDHPRLLSTMACQQLGLNDEQDEDDNYGAKHEWCSPPVEQLIQESGKMVFLVDLLEHLKKEGHRTLVFSQSRKMLDIIEKVLKDKGVKILRIDGTVTSIVERGTRINAFQNDPSYTVFLLTTQVGGVGLTLTAADRVVIFDPSWNPATDAKAVDRAYCIGQKKTVVIYRLIMCGSLEEKIYRRQVFKQAITKQTTGSPKSPFRYFTKQELRELFVLNDPKSSKTQKQLEAMHSANRQTDEKLDDHILFLKNTNIFGISDHDLIFTKEADSTKEELAAAVEMGDAIQAKPCQAADLLRMESSQARNNNNQVGNNKPVVQNDENANKARTQTKISDHVEVFVPSKNDNKRFMPKINKKQTQQDFEVIDITEVGDTNEINEEVLSEHFSAITLNGKDSAQNSPSNKDDIVQSEDDDHGLVQGLSDAPIDHQKHGISSGRNDHEISQEIAGSNHSTPKKNVECIQEETRSFQRDEMET